MLSTIELKNILIHRIAGINDKSFLTAIKTIVDTKAESIIYKTTSEQRLRIKEGKEQIARGEFYTNEQVEMEIDEWLKEN